MVNAHRLALNLVLGLTAGVVLAFGLLMMKSRTWALPVGHGSGIPRVIAA
jgi:hypothetical protein